MITLTCTVVMIPVPGNGSTGANAGECCQEALESMNLTAVRAVGPVPVNKQTAC